MGVGQHKGQHLYVSRGVYTHHGLGDGAAVSFTTPNLRMVRQRGLFVALPSVSLPVAEISSSVSINPAVFPQMRL